MRHHYFRGFLVFFVVTAAVFANSQLSALEKVQAIENCRASSGKPAYMACMQSGGTHDACFGKARAIVQSCVRGALVAAHPKAELFSPERLSKSPAAAGKPSSAEIAGDAAASLVAPPRTISDITAILEKQKPDPAVVAKLAATADAAAPSELKGADLADFYYKRAQARALLGRTDALDDAELALSNASSTDYNNLGSRYAQLLTRLLREAGQNKRANALVAKEMTRFADQKKGKLFGLNFSMLVSLVKSGDPNAAEPYAALNRSLLAEAQRW